MASILEMEEEDILSVESDKDEEEEEKHLFEDENSLTEMIIFNAQPNSLRFDLIENIIVADDQLINLEVLKFQL